MMTLAISNLLRYQPVRYVINGLVATCVSYAVLNACIHLAHVPSAGVANFIAAVIGITVSFLGSRHFVFPGTSESVWHQLARFWVLYAVLALLQAAVLFVWTDVARLDYRVGFLIGTFLQMVCSYFGGKHWVFKR
ncbi:GtrA family protein [Dyella terrae]|uniref:GtrA family protein n=1 Tax=Dyella terrae TaxID=522259 RepID=UPI001EFC77EF|nr:GtrA family protein [Dyella terrae]ULU25200.1 GtrA family protein [Dyella terrae]